MKMNSKTFQLPDKPEEQYRFFKGRVVLCILSYQTKKTESRTKRFLFFFVLDFGLNQQLENWCFRFRYEAEARIRQLWHDFLENIFDIGSESKAISTQCV